MFLISTRGGPLIIPARITYKYRNGKTSADVIVAQFNSTTTQGSSLYGDTFYHLFSKVVDSSNGISSYTVTVYESSSTRYPSAEETFAFQDVVTWLPGFSNVSAVDEQILGTISAAVSCLNRLYVLT